MRVAADRALCMGTGMCVMTAGEFFDQDDDGIVLIASDEESGPLRGEVGREVQLAVRLCPARALRLVQD